MKNQMKKVSIVLFAFCFLISCKKDDAAFLEEIRKDGLTVDNALITKAQFELALNTCYRQVQYFYNSTDGWTDYWHLGVNIDVAATTTIYIADPSAPWVDYTKINSQDAQSAKWWSWNYTLIKYANTVIGGVENKYAVTLSNGSVALELALKALNLKKRDEIIVSPRSFIFSASCVLDLELKPVFADVDNNGNLSIKGIKKAYNKNVKAIILVHLNGLSCDLDPILNFIKKNKIFLIEDCSQAHGAIYKDKKVGSFGHISTWSFCQDKIISTGGEGGMISTNSKKLWLKLWSLKDHGKNYKSVFSLA
jgi:hypothetical protein